MALLLRAQMARLLLECGARLHVHDAKGHSALHHAVLQWDKVRAVVVE